MSDTTNNTTSPPDPRPRRAESESLTSTIATVIAHSRPEPWRIGELARHDPRSGRPLFIGRSGASFQRQRPGRIADGGRLRGNKLSREQLEILPEGDGARIHNIGSTPVYVNGTQLPRDCSVRVALPAVVEIQDDTVLLVLRLPLAYPESHRLLEPHHPFGLVDRLGICGEGPRAWQLRLDIARAAVANKNVIAFGESGTGKELVARGIHALSHRARLPFVRVSFPDLPSGTAALRLNGGPANWPNPGTPRTLSPFEAGKGGVVFLDEIGEAPEEVQAILLTAFAGFYLYGTETTPRKVDSLLVAATNRPRSAIKFDVLHRIGTELDVPSLADRLEDLALVANHTLVEQVRGNTEYGGLLQTDATGRAWVEVEPDVIIQLLRAPPPGNIRQLEKKLGQLLAVSGGKGKLAWPDEWPRAAALPLDIRKELPHVAAVALMEGLGAQPTHAPPPVVESDQRPEIGRELLLQTLEETGWNIRATAAARGVSREKIYRLMEKYGLRRPE